jgi:hypothetical protein
MADPTLRLVPGRQQWLIARTDRDGASAAEVADMVAGFLQFTFRDVQGDQPGSSPEEVFPTGNHTWRVSAARPVILLLTPSQTEPPVSGSIIARREDLEELPLLNASRPWYLVVELWWRGPAASIPWPALQVTWAGTRQRDYTEADWLLLRSFVPPTEATDPGDDSWSGATSAAIGEGLRVLKSGLSTAALVVAGLFAMGGVMLLASRGRARRR